jgi:hypothetical protein
VQGVPQDTIFEGRMIIFKRNRLIKSPLDRATHNLFHLHDWHLDNINVTTGVVHKHSGRLKMHVQTNHRQEKGARRTAHSLPKIRGYGKFLHVEQKQLLRLQKRNGATKTSG